MSKRPPVTFISTKKAARKLSALVAQKIKEKVPIAVDTEFEPDTNEIVLMSLAWDSYGDRYVVEGKFVVKFFGTHLSNPKAKWVYQNFGADADVFTELGLMVEDSFHADTMIMGWLHDETLMSHGLKEQSFTFLNWRRQSYAKLFSYIPVGKKRPVVMTPKQVMYDLPPDALETHTAEEWRDIMLNYSGDDAASTIGLYWKHRRYLSSIDYWSEYLKHDQQFTLTLMRCEERGAAIDSERIHEILRLVSIRITRTVHVFRKLSGKPDLNLNSVPQLKSLLFDELKWPTRDDMLTATGSPSTDKEAMTWYYEEFGYALAKLKLAYNRESTKRSTFLEGIINGMDPETHRLHSHFNQIGADTGRISSRKQRKKIFIHHTDRKGEVKTRSKIIKVGANLQNIPSRKDKDPDGIRGAFIAPSEGEITAYGLPAQEDYVLIVADYSGFELCMAIYWLHKIGQHDSRMLQTMIAQKSPSAVHALTAMGMYGSKRPVVNAKNQELYDKVLVPKYGKDCRLKHLKMDDWKLVKVFWPDFYGSAKNGNFNLLYGGSASMMARLRGQDIRDQAVLDENQEFINNWNDLYPEILEYQTYMVRHGYKHGWVPTISGWRANVKALLESEDKKIRSYGERKCMNTPCQGSAANIVKVAMNRIEKDAVLRDTKSRFYFTGSTAPKSRYFSRPKMDSRGSYVDIPAVALLFPVHDEIVVEAPKRYADQVTARVVELMKTPYAHEFPFELDVEAKYAVNWLLAKG